MKDEARDYPVMLFDGLCGFCSGSVQMVLKHDKKGILRFAPLQSEFGDAVKSRHPILQNIDSVVWVDHAPASDPDSGKERIFVRSNAALKVAAYLGGIWKIFLLAYIIPRPLRDFFYDLFARYRYKFFGKRESCMIPSPEIRHRFI